MGNKFFLSSESTPIFESPYREKFHRHSWEGMRYPDFPGAKSRFNGDQYMSESGNICARKGWEYFGSNMFSAGCDFSSHC
jgi:hypothetical protein